MTPSRALAMYRRRLRAVGKGETVTLQRLSSPGLAIAASAEVRCRIMGAGADPLVAQEQQNVRTVVVLAADLIAAGFPMPPTKGDRILWRASKDETMLLDFAGDAYVWTGQRPTASDILLVDGETRRVGGTTIAYDLRIVGPQV